MSKFQLKCSCVHCRAEVTTQGLSTHIKKCTQEFKHVCEGCGKGTNNERFCSRSCRAKVVNTERAARKEKQPEMTDKEADTLCRFSKGLITIRSTLRSLLSKLKGYKCEMCGISEWNGQSITLIVDHIDGDAGNNMPTNLRLLCPNCNSQTPTFGGRNKGKGRKSRGLPTF
jgi:hypothetical protein